MNKEQLRKITTETQSRTLTIEKRTIDEEARTVQVAVSSETPVERWYGNEILNHESGSVRLARLQNGGAVLVDHDHREQVGVVENVTLDDDKVLRATLRLGRNPKAEELMNDIVDGIKRHISVGYRIHDLVLERESDEGTDYRATDWEPYEVSFVSVPADVNVGVGRSIDEILEPEKEDEPIKTQTPKTVQKERKMPDLNKPDVDIQEVRNAERARVQTIRGLGDKFNMPEEAAKAINSDVDVAEFRAMVLDKVPARQEATTPKTKLDMTDEETRGYSLMNAIRASVSGNWKGAGFERECSIAIADKLGKEARGFYVPFNVQERTMNKTTTAGDLVGTDHLAGSFIDSLRAQSIIGTLGAQFLTGLVGDVDIPRKTGSASFEWLGEDGDVSNSDLTLGNVSLSPKTVAGSVAMTRKLMKQSSPSIEALVMADLIRGASLAIDAAAFAGTGANNQPTGILNQTGVGTVTVADATTFIPTWAELIAFETALANANALTGSIHHVTTPSVRGGMKTAKKDAGSGIFIIENNEANGYPVTATTNLTAGQSILGNFNDLLVGMWGVLDVNPDPAAKAASGGLVLRVFQDVDIAVRHAQSFVRRA